jgi:hypothetical protein
MMLVPTSPLCRASISADLGSVLTRKTVLDFLATIGPNEPERKASIDRFKIRLERFEIGLNVETIGDFTFSEILLEQVFFPTDGRLREIRAHAFFGSALRDVLIPDTVQTFYGYCFAECADLISIVFAKNSTVSAFPEGFCQNCRSLARVDCPRSVTYVGPKAFAGCRSLKEFKCPKDGLLRDIELDAFLQSGVKSLQLSECFNYTSDVFPNGIVVLIQRASDGEVLPRSSSSIPKINQLAIEYSDSLQSLSETEDS